MVRQGVERSPLSPFLISGIMVAFLGVLFDFRGALPTGRTSHRHEACQGAENSQVALSRAQLAQFLTVSERDNRERVLQIVGDPYCQLKNVQVRAGVTAERQVYPLAFDPQTRLIILYEGNEYAGYRFSYQ